MLLHSLFLQCKDLVSILKVKEPQSVFACAHLYTIRKCAGKDIWDLFSSTTEQDAEWCKKMNDLDCFVLF